LPDLKEKEQRIGWWVGIEKWGRLLSQDMFEAV
jgi:hypothetical protein